MIHEYRKRCISVATTAIILNPTSPGSTHNPAKHNI